ncbi:MAG: class II glutamine amidotransferase [Alphaproteobacteria bacterium]
MCRWLTYTGRPVYLECLLYEPVNSLIQQSLHARKTHVLTNGDGFGFGWYGEREIPGLYRETLPAWNDPNLKSLAHQISSRMFFAHVRASTGTATSRANCHPFTHGRWMFMHNGQIGGYHRLRRQLDILISDEYYPYRQGTTDSELFFYLLFENGLNADPAGALARTLHQVCKIMREKEVNEPFRMTAALADGKRIFAIRYATDSDPPSLFWRCEEDRLLVVSEPLDRELALWNEVPPGHMISAEAGCSVSLQRLDA